METHLTVPAMDTEENIVMMNFPGVMNHANSFSSTSTGAHQESRTRPDSDPDPDGSEQERGPHRAFTHFGFVDADAMKEEVRRNLLRPSYDVRNYYHTSGLFQAIARSEYFERVTLAVITMNAIWISIDTDWNTASVLLQAEPVFQIMEHFFCVYFAFEWTVRFMSFRQKRQGFKDYWFVFDSALVCMMVLETWVMTSVMVFLASGSSGNSLGNASILRMARLMRLSRMARMARLFRAMPELLILVKGMLQAARSVFFTLCLLVILLYIFGIAFRQLTDATEIGSTYFATVPASMYTLLIDGTFMDSLGDVVRAVGDESPLCAALMWVFVLLSSLTVMNMLIGVLCEVVSAVAATEKEALIVNFVREKMSKLFLELDESGDGLINKAEFTKILTKPEAAILLHEVGVDVVGLVDQTDAIFMESDENGDIEKEMTFPDLMEVVLELRGTNTAKVKNIVDLRKTLVQSVSQIHRAIDKIQTRFDALEGVQSSMRRAATRVVRPKAIVLEKGKTAKGLGKDKELPPPVTLLSPATGHQSPPPAQAKKNKNRTFTGSSIPDFQSVASAIGSPEHSFIECPTMRRKVSADAAPRHGASEGGSSHLRADTFTGSPKLRDLVARRRTFLHGDSGETAVSKVPESVALGELGGLVAKLERIVVDARDDIRNEIFAGLQQSLRCAQPGQPPQQACAPLEAVKARFAEKASSSNSSLGCAEFASILPPGSLGGAVAALKPEPAPTVSAPGSVVVGAAIAENPRAANDVAVVARHGGESGGTGAVPAALALEGNLLIGGGVSPRKPAALEFERLEELRGHVAHLAEVVAGIFELWKIKEHFSCTSAARFGSELDMSFLFP